MIILSISTSSNICSVALLENGNVIEELNIARQNTFRKPNGTYR